MSYDEPEAPSTNPAPDAPVVEPEDAPAEVEADAAPVESEVAAAPVVVEDHAPPAAVVASNRGLKTAVAVLAALSLGLAIVAASLSASNRSDNNDKRRSEAVRRAAGAMGSALLTYDYQHLARTKSLVLGLSTGAFRKQYSQAFDGGLDTVLTNTKAVSHVRDIDVFVSDVTANDASAIVVVDTVVNGTSGQNRALTSYIQLDLVRTDGRWLVDGVTNLNLSLPATGGTSSTSTTAPSAPSTTR